MAKHLVMDADLRAKFFGGTAKVTLTDSNGKLVGHYLPDDLYQAILDTLVPEDDIREKAIAEYQQGEYTTTSEILAGLDESLNRWEGQS
jgi:hypothetical protein